MGLNMVALGATAARVGFELAGNAKESVVLKLGYSDAGEYDPEAGTVTATAGTDYPVDVIPYERQNRQTGTGSDGQISGRTETLLVQSADLPAGTEIQETDTVTRGGDTWAIVDAKRDPSGATWMLDVRR